MGGGVVDPLAHVGRQADVVVEVHVVGGGAGLRGEAVRRRAEGGVREGGCGRATWLAYAQAGWRVTRLTWLTASLEDSLMEGEQRTGTK